MKSSEYQRRYRERHPERCRAVEKRWREANPERVRAMQRAWYARNKERVAAWRKATYHLRKEAKYWHKIKVDYGMTQEQYNTLGESQGWGCRICGDTPVDHKLCVDHCHDTGKIRGLLCRACNVAIGNLKNSPDLCRASADYLEESEK